MATRETGNFSFVKDEGLKKAVERALADKRFSDAEVDKIIQAVLQDSTGKEKISLLECTELLLIIRGSKTMSASAKDKVRKTLLKYYDPHRFRDQGIAKAIQNGKLKWLTSRLSIYTVSRLAGLNTLATAVNAAGLRGTLIYDGPFTVFAPTEEAFGALPPGTIESLLATPDDLANILLYHVVSGVVVTSAEVVNQTEATMANGDMTTITVGSGVMINDANVVINKLSLIKISNSYIK